MTEFRKEQIKRDLTEHGLNAASIPAEDSGGFFSSENLEGITQELGAEKHSSGSDNQYLWKTIEADSGNTTAGSETDTFTIAGGDGLESSIVDDTLTIDISEDGVKNYHIDFGTGANQVSLDDVPDGSTSKLGQDCSTTGNPTFASVTGGNITSGEDPGHTHTASSITEADPVYSANTYATAMNQGVATTDSPTFVNATLSGKTAGSVLFAGTGGAISQDNANFYWDDTNNKLIFGGDANLYRSAADTLKSDDQFLATNVQRFYVSRTAPTTVNDYVNIGDFSTTAYTWCLDIGVILAGGSTCVSKRYFIVAQYGVNSTWQTVIPIYDSGVYPGGSEYHNFELEAYFNSGDGKLYLRFRRTGGTAYAAFRCIIDNLGYPSTTFTASTSTGSGGVPTATFANSALTQYQGKVGIGTTTPIAKLESYYSGTGANDSYPFKAGIINNSWTLSGAYSLRKYGLCVSSTGDFTGSASQGVNFGLTVNATGGGRNIAGLLTGGNVYTGDQSTLSADYATNGDMEVWTDPNTLTNWSSGGGTLDQESTYKYTGSYSAKLTGDTAYLQQSITTLTAGKIYLITCWLKRGNSSNAPSIVIMDNLGSINYWYHRLPTGVDELYFEDFYIATGSEALIRCKNESMGAAGYAYYDAVSVKEIQAGDLVTMGKVKGWGGLVTKVSTDNVSSPPTDAELDSAFGTPATVGAGFVGIVNDNGGGTAEYICWSDGTNWFYAAGTKAV